MKVIHSVALCCILGLSACATGTSAPEPTAVDPLLGKELVAENGTVFLFNADGTVGGTLRDQPVIGTYTADATEICSTYSSPDFLVGQEYCSVPAYDGDTVTFNRRDGSSSQPYKIGG